MVGREGGDKGWGSLFLFFFFFSSFVAGVGSAAAVVEKGGEVGCWGCCSLFLFFTSLFSLFSLFMFPFPFSFSSSFFSNISLIYSPPKNLKKERKEKEVLKIMTHQVSLPTLTIPITTFPLPSLDRAQFFFFSFRIPSFSSFRSR